MMASVGGCAGVCGGVHRTPAHGKPPLGECAGVRGCAPLKGLAHPPHTTHTSLSVVVGDKTFRAAHTVERLS